VEQLFFRGSGPCHKCGKVLKKNEFRDKVFDDAFIEKEVAIRKKHLKE
jgi:CDK-activating kinase assembly factor MAT1